jgi:hypothetical protein
MPSGLIEEENIVSASQRKVFSSAASTDVPQSLAVRPQRILIDHEVRQRGGVQRERSFDTPPLGQPGLAGLCDDPQFVTDFVAG